MRRTLSTANRSGLRAALFGKASMQSAVAELTGTSVDTFKCDNCCLRVPTHNMSEPQCWPALSFGAQRDMLVITPCLLWPIATLHVLRYLDLGALYVIRSAVSRMCHRVVA